MSTATASTFSKTNVFMGTFGAAPLAPSISLLGFVAAEVQKLFAKKVKAPLTRADEAEALRSYASDFELSDPRFADDLYAAAARHEGLI